MDQIRIYTPHYLNWLTRTGFSPPPHLRGLLAPAWRSQGSRSRDQSVRGGREGPKALPGRPPELGPQSSVLRVRSLGFGAQGSAPKTRPLEGPESPSSRLWALLPPNLTMDAARPDRSPR